MSYRSPAPAQPVLHGKARVIQLPETLRRRLFCGECRDRDRRSVAVLPGAKGEVGDFPEGFQDVLTRLCHGGHPRRYGCATLRIFILTALEPFKIHNDQAGEKSSRKPIGPRTFFRLEFRARIDENRWLKSILTKRSSAASDFLLNGLPWRTCIVSEGGTTT
jgi:hypothetical protein